MAAITALDRGTRIRELLDLKRSEVDLDNLCFKVRGKGDKYRLAPMSIELRKLLFRHLSQHQFDRVFVTSVAQAPLNEISRLTLNCYEAGLGSPERESPFTH
jgi:integrase